MVGMENLILTVEDVLQHNNRMANPIAFVLRIAFYVAWNTPNAAWPDAVAIMQTAARRVTWGTVETA